MRDLAFAVIWMALLPVSLVSAFVGVLLWVWVALLSPNELLFGFMSGVPFNKIVAVTTLGLVCVSREKKDFYLDGAMLILVLLAVSATVSWAGSIVWSADGTELYQKLLKDIVLAFVITSVMTTRLRLHLLALTIVVSFAFLGVKEGLISLLTAGGHHIIGSGSIGDNNSLATALLMAIPLNYYLVRYSAVRLVRMGLLVVLGLMVVTVIMTFSRGGFLGLVVLAGFMVKNSRNKFASFALVALAGLLIWLLAPAAWFQRLDTIQSADNDSSFMGRVVAWKISWLIAMDHPFFGGGMHAVQRLLVWDTYKPLLPQLDFITTPPADSSPHAAHSSYFEMLGDLGFVGFTFFIATLGAAFWNCRQIYRLSRGRPEFAWAEELSRMMQISMVVYVLTTAALSMGYFELLYIMVALLSRCRRTVRLALAAEAHGVADATAAMDAAPPTFAHAV